jgi:hypothetical protein
MRKSLWIALGVILALVLGVVAAACGGGSSSATTSPTAAGTQSSAPTGPIKIGIAISLTGDSAAPCQQIKEGFDTEAKYINDNGGINGRQVQLVYADDQSKMDTAMAAVQSLVDQKCDVIIGPFRGADVSDHQQGRHSADRLRPADRRLLGRLCQVQACLHAGHRLRRLR